MRPWNVYHGRTRADSLECDRCKESDTVEWGGQAHNILAPTPLCFFQLCNGLQSLSKKPLMPEIGCMTSNKAVALGRY